jgi:dihydroorotase
MMDLILRGGRVIDPANGIDRIADVGIAKGKIASVGDLSDASATLVEDVTGALVLPGLVDFHTHVYWGGTSLAVRAEPVAAKSGVTTMIDAGTSGASNFLGFRDHVIDRSDLRILAYLNISYAGIFAWTPTLMFGECSDVRLLDPIECVRVAQENPDLIVGIKVRLGRFASGGSGIAPLEMALQVAEEAELPVMAHIDFPPPGYRDVLMRLRPGDVLTHCYKPFPNSLLAKAGFVREDALLARERGVIFDIGHGTASFGLRSSRGLLAAGFPPDIISSDVHAMSIDGGRFDLLTAMSKFLALGLEVKDIVAAVTSAPAKAVSRSDFGDLTIGTQADITVLRLEEGSFTFRDAVGETIDSSRRFAFDRMFVAGQPWTWTEAPPRVSRKLSLRGCDC